MVGNIAPTTCFGNPKPACAGTIRCLNAVELYQSRVCWWQQRLAVTFEKLQPGSWEHLTSSLLIMWLSFQTKEYRVSHNFQSLRNVIKPIRLNISFKTRYMAIAGPSCESQERHLCSPIQSPVFLISVMYADHLGWHQAWHLTSHQCALKTVRCHGCDEFHHDDSNTLVEPLPYEQTRRLANPMLPMAKGEHVRPAVCQYTALKLYPPSCSPASGPPIIGMWGWIVPKRLSNVYQHCLLLSSRLWTATSQIITTPFQNHRPLPDEVMDKYGTQHSKTYTKGIKQTCWGNKAISLLLI